MPSRLKLGVRAAAALSEFGDFSVFAPLGPAVSWGEGISTEKSRFGSGNCLAMVALVVMVAVAECGESPLDDGDMLGGPLCCAGCDNAVGFPKVRAARRRGGTDSLLSSSTAATSSSTAAAPTPTGDDSDAVNSENTRTRGSLSNSHYRAATNKTESQWRNAGQCPLGVGVALTGRPDDGVVRERWEASPGSWERKVVDSYLITTRGQHFAERGLQSGGA